MSQLGNIIDLYKDLAMFLISWLLKYSDLIHYLGMECKISMSTVLVGDFNRFENDREKRIERISAFTFQLATKYSQTWTVSRKNFRS